jgi:hypothetical protein
MRHPIQTQLYGLPHEILHVFNTILYKNEFQNPRIQQTMQSTLAISQNDKNGLFERSKVYNFSNWWHNKTEIYLFSHYPRVT